MVETLRLVVLIPHPAVEHALRPRGGFAPFAAPLARLSRPLRYEELRGAARRLRLRYPAAIPVRGFELELDARGLFDGVVEDYISALAELPLSITRGTAANRDGATAAVTACALANMTLRRFDGGFEWQTGRLSWLPRTA